MPIAHVQSSSATGTSTSPAKAYVSNNTAGNLLVAIVVTANGADTTAVVDSAGNTWAHAVTAVHTGSNQQVEIWYAMNCAAGANTVTATISISEAWGITVFEYSGIATASALDQVAGTTNALSGTALNSGDITTTQNDELIVGGGSIRDGGGNSLSVGAALTERSNGSAGTRDFETSDRIVSSTGTYAWTATAAIADQWAAAIASFKGGGAPPPSLVPSRRMIGWMPAA